MEFESFDPKDIEELRSIEGKVVTEELAELMLDLYDLASNFHDLKRALMIRGDQPDQHAKRAGVTTVKLNHLPASQQQTTIEIKMVREYDDSLVYVFTEAETYRKTDLVIAKGENGPEFLLDHRQRHDIGVDELLKISAEANRLLRKMQ